MHDRISTQTAQPRGRGLPRFPLVTLAYLSAVVGPTFLVAGKFLWLDPREDAPFLLFFGQIVLAGAIGGFFPALVATVASGISISFLLLPPVGSFAVADPDAARVLTFVVEGIAVSGLVGWLHRSWRNAREALVATRAANDRVREAWRDRTLVLAEASHEIRQPLARLLSQLRVARKQFARTDNESALVARLDSAIEAARSLNGLTQELLDVAHADGGFTGNAPETLDLRDLAREVVLRYAGQATRIELELPARPLPITGDRVGLGRVLENLLTNALKYGDGSSILLEVGVDEKQGEALARVHNSGIGIPVDERTRVFGPFYRARNTKAATGHGLGLWTARRIAQENGGRLWIESGGEQTTLTLALPLSRELRLWPVKQRCSDD